MSRPTFAATLMIMQLVCPISPCTRKLKILIVDVNLRVMFISLKVKTIIAFK